MVHLEKKSNCFYLKIRKLTYRKLGDLAKSPPMKLEIELGLYPMLVLVLIFMFFPYDILKYRLYYYSEMARTTNKNMSATGKSLVCLYFPRGKEGHPKASRAT